MAFGMPMAAVGKRGKTMTPTLIGRWQTRLWLMAIIGSLVTILLGGGQIRWLILGYVILLGLGWDLLYTYWQSFHWDRDWPPTHQLLAGLLEGTLLWLLIWFNQLPALTAPPTFTNFLAHYGFVWLATFLASQSLLRIIYPRWRYRGGQWLGNW